MKARLTIALAAIVVVFAAGSMRSSVSRAASDVDGKAVFATKCASCHQATGLGGGPFPPLAGNADVTSADTGSLIGIVLNGKAGPITINGKQFSGSMPAWKGQLTNAEIAAVLTYIRSAWTNKSPAISEDQVASAAKPAMASGEATFLAKCASCHQATGIGTAAYPPLAGNPHVVAADPKDIVTTIVNGRSGALSVNGKSYNGTMPTWKGQLSNPDIAAVATYIRSAWTNKASGVTEQQVASAGTPVLSAVGQAVYAKSCAGCHKANGTGMGGMFPALAGNAHVNAADASAIITTIVKGRNVMPAWKGQLSNADIAAVVTFIRGAWGNSASPITDQDVAAIK